MADDIMFVIGVDDRDLIKAQKEQIKFQRNLITIEKAFRSGDITAGRYNAELAKQARQLQTLGGSYNQASSEVRKYAYAMRQADDATLSQAQAMGFAGKNINRMGANLQQVGYQVGDFAVQVQGGTNVMVALGQQGAQLLGIFGPAGAIAGAGLAITTAFLAPLMRVKDEAKDAADATKAFDDRVKSLSDTLREYARVKKAVSLGLTPEELTGVESLQAAKDRLEVAKEELKVAREYAFATAQAGGIGMFFGVSGKAVDEAKVKVEQAEKDLAAIQAKVRQDAREKAEAILNDQYEQQQRDQALAEYNAGQAAIAERVSWVEEATKIFRDAQKKMRDEEVAETERSLDRLFRNRTLMYSIRFSGDADVMSQALTPSTKGMKPTQSYQELIAMGWSPEDLERIGVKAPRKSGGSRTAKTKESPLEKLQAQLKLEQELIGKSEEYARVRQALGESYDKVEPKQIANLENQIRLIEEAKQAEQDRLSIMGTVESSMEEGFMSMIDGTASVGDAFKEMARQIIAELMRVLVVKRMVAGVTSLFGFADGGAFSGGSQIQAYADGGVVGGPTFFPMSGGKTGLMGEAGPEAIMPLKRGANGKLGVQMEGGGGDNITVNQSFNFSANGDDSVKRIIAQAAPQIANMTQKQIMDSRRRGGAMKSTFG